MSNKAKSPLKGWSFICHELEIDQKNSFVNIELYDKEVFAYKDKMEVKVYDNFCNHRGCKLVEGSSGLWNGSCPYHGLRFENGQPINSEDLGLKKSDSRLTLNAYRVEKVGGFIFFTDNDDEVSLKDFLGEKTSLLLTDISSSLDTLISDEAYLYDCRIEVAIENALEPLHLESIHPNSLNELKLGIADNYFSDNSVIFTQDIGNEKTKKGLLKLQKFFESKFEEKYQSTFIFPSFFISSTFGFSFSVQTFYPSNDKFKTHFRSRIYSSKLLDDNKSTILKSFFDSTISINKQIFKEDYEICSRVNKQEKHYIGPLAETEEKLIWYRKKLK